MFDDPSVADEEVAYRRVPRAPNHRTFDLTAKRCRPSTACFSRSRHEVSVHLRGLMPPSRLPPATYPNTPQDGIAAFRAEVPRRKGGGIVIVDDPDEADPVLRSAHAEVRPGEDSKRRWAEIRELIISESWWAKPVGAPCASNQCTLCAGLRQGPGV